MRLLFNILSFTPKNQISICHFSYERNKLSPTKSFVKKHEYYFFTFPHQFSLIRRILKFFRALKLIIYFLNSFSRMHLSLFNTFCWGLKLFTFSHPKTRNNQSFLRTDKIFALFIRFLIILYH